MITFLVGEKVQPLSATKLTSGSVNDTEILFKFKHADEWSDLTKIAVFTAKEKAVRVALENNKCFIPADVLEESGDLTIGVYGYEMGDNEEVALRKSPTPLEISVWNGSYNKDATDPTPEQVDICEQALLTAQNAETTAQSVRDDADAGVFDGEDGVSVSNANINEYGDLIMSMSNGQSVNAGNVLPALQNKTITPSEIPQTAVADDGYYALGSVAVEPIEVEELETITENGTYTADEGKYFKEVTVDTTNTDILFSASGRQYSTKITLPNTVGLIGDHAFQNCTNLESIEIPNSVTSIESNAFYGCTNLESIEIPNSVTSIGDHAFQNCTNLESIEIPNSVTSIGNSSFQNCTNLKSIEIPNSVTSIGNSSFLNCTNLKSIEIPSSVQTIYISTFSTCLNLKKAKLQHGVKTLLTGAFRNCAAMTDLELPNTLTSINVDVFFTCGALKNISLENGFLATVNFSESTRFTADDMVSMLSALGTVPEGETRTFTLGATNLAKLTAEQKAIATDKGWTLA